MRNEIDKDLLDFPKGEQEDESIAPADCTFCLFSQRKLTKEELRIMWDLHTPEPLRITCTTCNKVIVF